MTIWFVCSTMTAVDKKLGSPFTGEAGRWLYTKCLKPLGLKRADAGLWSLDQGPIPALDSDLVVAVGTIAKRELGSRAIEVIPHPYAVISRTDTGETARKIKRVLNLLTAEDKPTRMETDSRLVSPKPTEATEHTGEPDKQEKTKLIQVAKKVEELQIVYGTVLDPYIIDAHGDWTPPSEVQKVAHDYLHNSRETKHMHESASESYPVESWVEQYPSREDYLKAMANQPHRAFRRKFGNDFTTSGSWNVGMKLSDKEWAEFQAGELNAFSPGGVGSREQMTKSDMPEVEFIDVD